MGPSRCGLPAVVPCRGFPFVAELRGNVPKSAVAIPCFNRSRHENSRGLLLTA